MTPLVTLAVTTLNRTQYLREALSSVLAQDYPNLDILVSDNGSCDETPALGRALIKDDCRARFRRNEATVPSYVHFNQCVQEARGEFFILLCDDDRINPGFVSELVGVAMRHLDVNVVVPANVTIDEQGAVIQEFATPDGEVFDGHEFACHWLYQRPCQVFACVVTSLMRTEVIRRFGGYQGFARGQKIDNMLFLQCAITGRVGFARGAVFNWRVYNHSYGATTTLKQIVESAREFVRHLRNDRPTIEALTALPKTRRDEVMDGVRTLHAREFLFQINFYDVPFGPAMLRKLLMFPFDAVFYRIVLGHYYTRLRLLLRPGHRAEMNQPPASLSSK